MKKLFFSSISILALLVLTLSNCNAGIKSQKSTKIMELETFNEMELSGTLNVIINQGDKEQIKIVSSPEMIECVNVYVENNKLTVAVKKGWKFSGDGDRIDVYITFKKVTVIDVDIVGNFSSKSELHLDTITLNESITGNSDLTLNCKSFYGSFKGTGNATIQGTCEYAEIERRGVGNMNTKDFIVQVLKLKSSGVGNVGVRAEKELYLKSSGVGNVSYTGNAVIKEVEKSGVGNLSKD